MRRTHLVTVWLALGLLLTTCGGTDVQPDERATQAIVRSRATLRAAALPTMTPTPGAGPASDTSTVRVTDTLPPATANETVAPMPADTTAPAAPSAQPTVNPDEPATET
ncbi:MAG: hypothetical protein PVJ85_16855, partial [Anaerolineae bacterium]